MSEFPAHYFGDAPAQTEIVQQHEAARFEDARDAVLDRIQLATTDHTGRRLNERRWRWLKRMVESL